MNYRKHGAKLLGLLAVAALGAMALAASAQAVVPTFLVAGKAVGEVLKPTVEAEQIGAGSLLVPGLNFKLTCQKFTVDEGVINSNVDAKAVLLYTECTTLSITKSPEEIPCHVAEPVKAEALILPAEMLEDKVTKEALPWAVLAEKIKALIRLWEPNAAKPLTNECTLPNDNTVTGELCLKIKVGTNETPNVILQTNDDIQILCKPRKTLEGLPGSEGTPQGPDFPFKDLIKYGGQDVFVDGEATLKLTSEGHKGLNLGVCLL